MPRTGDALLGSWEENPVGPAEVTSEHGLSRHFEKQSEPVDAIATGFPRLDAVCGDAGGGEGLGRGWMIVLAGATGVGKTRLALNVAANAVKTGKTVAYVSLEMSLEQVRTRIAAILSGEPVRSLERGKRFDPEAAEKATTEVRRICDSSGGKLLQNAGLLHDVKDVTAFMAYLQEHETPDLFVLDYAQLISCRSASSMYEAITTVSASLREFAKRNDAAVLVLSQFNRETTKEKGTRPDISGLLATSQLENDSDLVVMLSHADKDLQRSRRGEIEETILIVGKNRHGPLRAFPVRYENASLRIREKMPDEEERRVA